MTSSEEKLAFVWSKNNSRSSNILYNSVGITSEKQSSNLHKTDSIKKLKYKIPSIVEQNKIASFLSSIDKKIELVDFQLERNKEFKKGLLQQMFVWWYKEN